MNTIQTHKLNKRERKAAQLLAHYATCERLALAMGMPSAKADGKKISVALLKLETIAHQAAEHYCSEPGPFRCYWPHVDGACDYSFNADEEQVELFKSSIALQVRNTLGSIPPGFFVNFDPRGYALKIDPADPAGKKLIKSCNLHTDWGRNGILSPEITGN